MENADEAPRFPPSHRACYEKQRNKTASQNPTHKGRRSADRPIVQNRDPYPTVSSCRHPTVLVDAGQEVTASLKGMMSRGPPKVRWRATRGEPVGPYVRNSIRPDVLASLRTNGEARRPEGRRRETALPGKSPERETDERMKRTWKDIGWLETERQGSSGVVNRGDPPPRAERSGGSQSLRTSWEAP